MVKVSEVILVTRNARDKIQIARYVLEQAGNTYFIRRFTGQFGGKVTTQPEKKIEKGKVKRSVLQQAELEYNSLIKKALDKGYKKLSDLTKTKFEVITEQELNSVVASIKTDTNGNIKPQQAKSHKDCATSVFNKERWNSRKLDGVRCMMKWHKEEDRVVSVSRGGGDYDAATVHIRTDDMVVQYLRNNPDTILDGELYIHGWPLQKISGTCRLKDWDPERCSKLEYWVYDIADTETVFNERLDTLTDLDLYFEDTSLIKVCEHVLSKSWNDVERLHNKWVKEGYEGLVSRATNKKYEPGKRNTSWVKVKIYQDDEFEITGISEGLRPEDMCFILKTKNGGVFKAKPMGSRELREEYLANWESYVGKMGTVKYFELSVDGIPIGNTVFKCIREGGE